MIETALERELGRNRFRISSHAETGEADGSQAFKEKMLKFNRIPGILDFETDRLGDRKYYNYDISGMESLKEYCEKEKPGCDYIVATLEGLLTTASKLKEYMLEEEDLVMTPEAIFVNKAGEVGLAYFPGFGKGARQQLCELGQYLLDKLDYQDDAAVMLVYSFYMKTKENDCSYEDLLDLLRTRRAGRRSPGGEACDAGRSPGAFGDEPGGSSCLEEGWKGSRNAQTPDCRRGRRDKEADGSLWGRSSLVEAEGDTKWGRGDDQKRDIRSGGDEIFEIKKDAKKEETHYRFADLLANAPYSYRIKSLGTIGLAIGIIGGLGILSYLNYIAIGRLGFCLVAGLIVGAAWLMELSFKKKIMERIRQNRATEEEPTVLLYAGGGEGSEPRYSFVSKEYEAIIPDHFPYFVGKDREQVDYALNVRGVSRYHLKIDKSGDRLTVSDLNSTNGSFVNGVRLAPHLPQKLVNGDEVRIADCVFYCNS